MSQILPTGVTPDRFAAALARIKGALDPHGVLSPGKQGIWPAETPWSPSSNGSPPAPERVHER